MFISVYYCDDVCIFKTILSGISSEFLTVWIPIRSDILLDLIWVHARVQRGGRGSSINTGPDPLKTTKLPSQHSMLAIIGPPVKRHYNGVSLAGRYLPAFSGLWSLS